MGLSTVRARRQVVAISSIALCFASVLGLAGCTNPTASVQKCVGAPDQVVSDIQQKLTAAGSLRNGKMVTEGSGYTFVSAELHAAGDAKHQQGDILTWATRDPTGADFVSVDVHARSDSTCRS